MGEDLGGGKPETDSQNLGFGRLALEKDKKNWIELSSTPSPVARRIEEGCALVPPRQFIRTSGGFKKVMERGYDTE